MHIIKIKNAKIAYLIFTNVQKLHILKVGDKQMTLKEFRNNNGITQLEASKIVGMPLRTYVSYENDLRKSESLKYKMIFSILMEIFKVDEEHGVLKLDYIIKSVGEVLKNYKVEFCYLFGSYAKDKASEDSDIDLLIQTSETGLTYFKIIEELREKLNKRIDLLSFNQLKGNQELLMEILKDGIKIYG